jgi:hypothetical protein
MSIQADTRLFDGTIIQVRNAADSAWITFARLVDFSLPGTPSTLLDASTAAGYRTRVGLPDVGQGTLNVFDNPDDPFLAEMEVMRLASQTRRFQIIMREGTLVMKEFQAYLSALPIKGTYNNY